MTKIREAATVLLVRESAQSPEVFMVKRPGRGDFPDLHVYPGGKVDGDDAEFESMCAGLDDVTASSMLSVETAGLRFWVTVIRECFEEAGVLLAERDGRPFEYESRAEHDRYQVAREQLVSGELVFSEFVRSEGLQLATDRVHYHSHWITPESAPARFDTRFFIAPMPAGQIAVGHLTETVSGEWVTPANALELKERGSWQLIYPTLTTLSSVRNYASVETMIDAVKAGEHIGEVTHELHFQGMQHDSASD